MKTKFPLFILMISILFLASDCDRVKDRPTYYLDQEIKDYTLFPIGSYWIYKDSLTNNIDTVSIISQTIEIYSGGEEPIKWEVFSQNRYSSYNNDTVFGFGESYALYSEGFCTYGERGWCRFFSQKEIGYMLQNYLLYENYYDSLFINNKWYKEIKVFKFSFNSPDTSIIERYYYGKNIGLIKKENADSSENWLLTSYHINN